MAHMIGRTLATLALPLALLLTACRPHAGGACDKDDALTMTCTSLKSALVCSGGTWVQKPCNSPCRVDRDPQGGPAEQTICDDVANPVAGDACYLPASAHGMPSDESACARDGKAVLACRADVGHAGGGAWKLLRACTGKQKCTPDRGPYCVE